MNNEKAAGPDGIVAEHIRMAEPVIIDYLLYIFNSILIRIEKYPILFKKGLLTSLFKGDTNNYRDITFIFGASKII